LSDILEVRLPVGKRHMIPVGSNASTGFREGAVNPSLGATFDIPVERPSLQLALAPESHL